MRISDASYRQRLDHDLLGTRDRYLRQQQQIARGEEWTRRSQDPTAANQYSTLERHQAANHQWQANLERANLFEQVTNNRLDEALEALQRLQEIGVEGNNDANGSSRAALAEEVDQILEQLASAANARHGDSYLFAGNGGGQPPFAISRDDEGRITALSYQGGSAPRQAQVDDDTRRQYGVTGDAFIDGGEGVDVFAAAVALRDELAAGDGPSEATQQAVQEGLDHVVDQVVSSGIRQRQFEHIEDSLVDRDMTINQRLGDLKDLDLAKAVTELSQLESSYQAAMQMAARINRLSMVDFI